MVRKASTSFSLCSSSITTTPTSIIRVLVLWSFLSSATAQVSENDGPNFCRLLTQESCAGSWTKLKRQNMNWSVPFANIDATFNPVSLKFGDLDKDGDFDVMVGGRSSTHSRSLLYFENIGSPAIPQFVAREGSQNPLNPLRHILFCSCSNDKPEKCTSQNTQNCVQKDAVPSFADLDHDGDLDLLVGGEGLHDGSGELVYLKNTGNSSLPTFTLRQGADNPMNGLVNCTKCEPDLADLDDDGDFDLVVNIGYPKKVLYFENIGNLTALFVARTGTLNNPMNLIQNEIGGNVGRLGSKFVDMDNDGDFDLVVRMNSFDPFYFENTGSRTNPSFTKRFRSQNENVLPPVFTTPKLLTGVPDFVDIDNDGDTDMLLWIRIEEVDELVFFETIASSDMFNMKSGSASPTSQVDTSDGIYGGSASPETGDIDGDGDLDLVVGSLSGELYFYENTGSPEMPSLTLRTGALNPMHGINVGVSCFPKIVDLDNDGDLDLVVASGATLAYFKNIGNATNPSYGQTNGVDNPLNGITRASGVGGNLEFADINQDGALDILLNDCQSDQIKFRYFENTGNSPTSPSFIERLTFQNPYSMLYFPSTISNRERISLRLADIDHDNDLDLVMGLNSGHLLYFENQKVINSLPVYMLREGEDSPLNEPSKLLVGGHQLQVLFADLDNDGDLDLLAGSQDGIVKYFETNYCEKQKTCNLRGNCLPPTANSTIYTCDCGGIWDGFQCENCPLGAIESLAEGGNALFGAQSPTCTKCGAGMFSDILGYKFGASCQDCPTGYFGDSENAKKCQQCPQGFKQKDKGKTMCHQCLAGFYPGDIECLQCVAGRYMDYSEDADTLATECKICGIGQYQDDVAKGTCKDIPPGSYASDNGASTICEEGHACKGGANAKTECDPGMYSTAGSISCIDCAPGTFAATTGSNECEPCDENEYQPSAKASSCKVVEPGHYQSGPTTQVICPAGKAGKGGSAKCQDCNEGWYRGDDDAPSACLECAIGTTSNKGSAGCSPCALGKFHDKDKKQCADCPVGTYQDFGGSTACKDCPVDTYSSSSGKSSKADCQACDSKRSTGSSVGNVDSSACLCKRIDFYKSVDDECLPCPTGADCSAKDGLTLAELTAKPGYWRPDLTSDVFTPCVDGYSSLDAQELANARCCPVNTRITANTSICSNTTFKHTNEQCKKEYAGSLCLVCAEGYVKQGTTCIECEGGASIGTAALPLIGLLLGLFFLLMIFLVCGKKAEENAESGNTWFGQVKIMLSFLQIFSSMPGVLDGVPWPNSFLQFSLPLNIFNMDFLAILAKSGCSMNVRFYDKFILHMTLPIGCLIVIVLAYFTAKTCCAKKEDTQKQTNMKETASKAVILVILLIFPGLATKIFTMFKCKTIEGIPGSLLVEDYDQRCYEGEHFTFMIVGLIFLCLYVVGIPLIMFVLLWRNKKHLHDEKSPKHRIIKNALGGMYTQYEPSYWWFEIFLLFNKTMMCGGLVMAAPGTPLQVLIATLIMLCHLLVVLKLAPYESNGEDSSSFLSSLTLTLTTIGGTVLMMDGDSDGSNKTFNSDGLAYILIAISVLCIASQIGITIFVDCGVWEKRCGKNENKKSNKGGETKVFPIVSVNEQQQQVQQNNATKAWETE